MTNKAHGAGVNPNDADRPSTLDLQVRPVTMDLQVRRTPRFVLLVFGMFCVFFSDSAAGQTPPIYEQEPFDRLTLDKANGNAVLTVFPLDLPQRQDPTAPRPSGRLRIRLLSRPDDEYEVSWQHVAKVELFEQIVLAAAQRLTAQGKYDEAFDHYAFLWRRYPDLPGLRPSYQRFLVNNAFASYRAGKWEDALVELTEVRRLQPNRPGLDSALARVNDQLVETYVHRGDFAAARRLLKAAVGNGDNSHLNQLSEKWTGQLKALAEGKVAEARKLRDTGQMRQAYVATRKALEIWPALNEAAELGQMILRQYAMVTVGVTQPSVIMDPRRIDNWASRRCGRLHDRLLAELIGTGSEGGRYACPVGTLLVSEDRRQITIQLRGSNAMESQHDYTGFDVARRLLAMAEPNTNAYSADWRRQMAGVLVRDVYNVDVDLKRPHLRIESLLRVGLGGHLPGDVSGGPARLLSPYTKTVPQAGQTLFVANSDYLLATESQPREIVEQQYVDDAEQAIRALLRGEVDVLDRVFPAEVSRLRRQAGLVIGTYAIPSIHMLVPNVRHDYMARRDIRRALVYGINRQEILDREILGGESIEGCRLISGPLPPGTTPDDPLGYGYNEAIAARPYQPRLAYTLAAIGIRGAVERAKKRGADPPGDPALILAHPASEVARIASQLIAQQLSWIGLPCTTRRLKPGTTRPTGDDWDLLYLEAWIAEPLVDIGRLLGSDGVLGESSPYLGRQLELLAGAETWKQARDRLLEVHRTVHEEVDVVPLWQLVDHFAYRRGLQGIGRQPVCLYANVERWQWRPGAANRAATPGADK